MSTLLLTWKTYEELVRNVYEQLGQANGVKILGFGSACHRQGKSGVEHQIDVLTSHSDGIHDYLTDIECKYWDQKINKDIVMKVNDIVEDCNFSKGIIVSKMGFTPDAAQFARYRGIGLVELREMTDSDWKGRIRKIIINIEAKWPELDNVVVELTPSDEGKSFQSGNYSGNPALMEIVYPSGETISFKGLLENTFFKELKEVDDKEPIKKIYQYEKGTKLIYKEYDRVFCLRTISITGHMESMNVQDVIENQDEVLYYMKCIFEGKELLLGNEGKVLKQNEVKK